MDDDSMDESTAEDVEVGADIDALEPVTWTRPGSTGVASVDAAIEELTRLDQLPTGEHAPVYDSLHRELQDALADLDGA